MRHPGDGIRMALEAGAEVEGNFTMEAAAPKIKGYDALNLFLGKPYNVWLNRLVNVLQMKGLCIISQYPLMPACVSRMVRYGLFQSGTVRPDPERRQGYD